jgi:hypothetical protein
MYLHVRTCVSCIVQPPSSPSQRDIGIQYPSSHCSHSQSIELIDKNSLHEFFCTFYDANKHSKKFF